MGVSEETTTGVLRLYQMASAGTLLFPAINVNDSVTKSKFDNKYGIRHSLPDGLMRATDVLIGGKVVVVCGYGDVGKGCRGGHARPGRPGHRHRDRPDLRAAGGHGRLPGGHASRTVLEQGGHLRHHHRRQGHHHRRHMSRMKHKAIVGNVGHFDNEIDMAGLARVPGVHKVEYQAAGPRVDLRRGRRAARIIVLSEGRLLNLGNATGHPSFVMSNSFANQVIAQIELFTKAGRSTRPACTCCPRSWTRRWPGCTWTRSASELSQLTKEQADYIGVPVDGPYKPETYRY